MLQHRSTEPELMDDLDYQGEDLAVTLKELDFINKWLGGDQISRNALRSLTRQHPIHSIADLGCGSGKFLHWVKRTFPEVRCAGVDANPAIVELAKKAYPEVEFQCENIQHRAFSSQPFDVIHCCLFLHHFTNTELAELFRSFHNQVSVGIIVNDLHRHSMAYFAIKLLTRLFSRSTLVRHDASLSVRRGFKKKELEKILEAAGIEKYELSWKWIFRWQLIIYK